ncbi:MAG: 2-hydroxyacyl-CoA dehydratase subunit D [Candidatus Brocadiales bacterium]
MFGRSSTTHLINTYKTALVRGVSPWALKQFLRILPFFIKDDPTKELKALNFCRRAALRYLHKAYGKDTVWTTIFTPSELLYAMGVTPFPLEVIAAIYASFGLAPKSLIEADSQDIPTDVCSLHKLALGCAFRGLLPRPVMLAGNTLLCDSGIKSMNVCQSITGKRLVTINVPLEISEGTVRYVAIQLKHLVEALEDVTGRGLDMESLQKTFERSNRTRERMLEINDLRINPASPLKGSSALNLMLPSHVLLGTEDGEEFYTRLAQEIKKAITSGEKFSEVKKADDTIKILWLEGKHYFSSELMPSIEERLGARIVFEEQNYVYWDALDINNPYESLARKLISMHWNGPTERRLSTIKHLARNYRADGIIVFSQWGCRRNNAQVPAIKRELEREGFPLLSLDGDYVDRGNYMPGQFATRIEGFVEMLRGKKKARIAT